MSSMSDFLKESRESSKIDLTNLDREVSEQPARYLIVAEQSYAAKQRLKSFKLRMGADVAKLSTIIRKTLNASEKKVTEKMVENELHRHPKFLELNEELYKLEAQSEVLNALKESYYMRKDLIVQACISKRTEMTHLSNSVKTEN